MTPWHRFWFPAGSNQRVPPDAALWSPEALTELQQSLWHQAAEATAQWWRFVSAAWPGVPLQPPTGHVSPLAPEPATAQRRAAARPQGPRAVPTPVRKAAAAPKRPRSAARGK
jgi:hypothetical protein